jgi:adenosylcobinamide-phosphate synthase
MFAALTLAALLIEAIVGYPNHIYRRAGHPVTWLGALISQLERRWNLAAHSERRRHVAGVVVVAALILVAVGAGLGLSALLEQLLPAPWALLACAVLASTLLAQRSLDDHVADVAGKLESDGLEGGRSAVAMIVGRDPQSLDEAGVCRAAIESLAENFSDGVVAPAFWLLIAGLPGGIAYKAINTADSMIGHKSERYRAFGWAAARTDDVLNLPASRLAALWLMLAAFVVKGCSASGALRAVWRDAGKHRSPNAGWPEAAMAGALGLRLAGPRSYNGEIVNDHWMGDGRAETTATDIHRALVLYRTACFLQIVAVATIAAATLLA